MPLILDGSLGETFPSWTTATRPASPAVGQMGYNTTTGQFDAYTSNGWVSVATSATAPTSGPAFSAYLGGSNQSISALTWTKVQLNTESFDTNNNFDSTTNYRFTPTTAGYYQINASILFSLASGTATATLTSIYKNGARVATNECTATVPNGHSTPISTLIYMNGSTDYIELYGYCSSSSASFTSTLENTFMAGSLVRAA